MTDVHKSGCFGITVSKSDFLKIKKKKFSSKNAVERMKRQAKTRKKMLTKCKSNKGILSRI